jgi:hypothetical protein
MLLLQHAQDTPRRATPGALWGREAGDAAGGEMAVGSTESLQRVWTRPTGPDAILPDRPTRHARPQTELDGDRHDQADDDANDRDRA